MNSKEHSGNRNLRRDQEDDTDNKKRQVPGSLRRVLDWDAQVTNEVNSWIQSKLPNVSKSETKVMEISGSGFVWLPCCVIMYMLDPLVPKQLALNLIIALLLDIIFIGFLKAFARRRRPPTKKADYFKSLGPDRYSFPSGHASRSVLIALIFSHINPLFDESFFQLVVTAAIWSWCLSVCVSRMVNGRHYLLDVLVGILIGFFESAIVSYIWMSPEGAEKLVNLFSEEVPEI